MLSNGGLQYGWVRFHSWNLSDSARLKLYGFNFHRTLWFNDLLIISVPYSLWDWWICGAKAELFLFKKQILNFGGGKKNSPWFIPDINSSLCGPLFNPGESCLDPSALYTTSPAVLKAVQKNGLETNFSRELKQRPTATSLFFFRLSSALKPK